ncbi:MAG: hypothetical protein AAFR31_08585 [Cyanobacteria bacterium J06627_8]
MSQDASLQASSASMDTQHKSMSTTAPAQSLRPSQQDLDAEHQTSNHVSPAESHPTNPEHEMDGIALRNQSEQPSLDPQSYIEAIASETMQEVFDDVDRLLGKGAIVTRSSTALDDLDDIADFSNPHAMAGGALTPLDPSLSDDRNLTLPNDDDDDDPLIVENPAATPERFRAFLVTLTLIITSSVALSIGLAFWMAQRSRVELAAVPGGEGLVSNNVPPTVPSEFAEGSFEKYFQDALATIDRRYEQEAEEEPDSLIPLPPPPPPTTAGNAPLVIDRGYIDVYQQPQVAAAPPAPAPAPAPAAPQAPSPSTAQPAPVQNISPNNTHTLVGILELGDRSAAIFEYAGSAHRIEIGEQIGGSGWSLVSVSGQEAIIRRNGEVRSIYMKQSF